MPRWWDVIPWSHLIVTKGGGASQHHHHHVNRGICKHLQGNDGIRGILWSRSSSIFIFKLGKYVQKWGCWNREAWMWLQYLVCLHVTECVIDKSSFQVFVYGIFEVFSIFLYHFSFGRRTQAGRKVEGKWRMTWICKVGFIQTINVLYESESSFM